VTAAAATTGLLALALIGWACALVLGASLLFTGRALCDLYGAVTDHHAKRGHLTLADDEELWRAAGLIYSSVEDSLIPGGAAALSETERRLRFFKPGHPCPDWCAFKGTTGNHVHQRLGNS
jgi:hypothetical protein